MTKMQISYDGNLHTTISHETSEDVIFTDAPIDNEGKGEAFSPTDLVGAALGSCIATVIGIYAKRKNWDLEGMKIYVQKDMVSDPLRRIAKLHLQIHFPTQVSDEEKKKIEKIALSCPVHHSLHPKTEINIVFHWATS